jgi:hypothetical protein
MSILERPIGDCRGSPLVWASSSEKSHRGDAGQSGRAANRYWGEPPEDISAFAECRFRVIAASTSDEGVQCLLDGTRAAVVVGEEMPPLAGVDLKLGWAE